MTKVRTLFTSASIIPVVSLLVLAAVFAQAPPALAYCPPPPGVTTPEEPSVTAQQVEDGSASLKDFALASRERFVMQIQTAENLGQVVYYGCLFRQEGSYWHSGSTYLVILRADGSILIHAKNMALASRRLNPLIYAEILSALGVPSTVLGNLASPDSAVAAQAAADVFEMSLICCRKDRMPHSMRPPQCRACDPAYRVPPAMPPHIGRTSLEARL